MGRIIPSHDDLPVRDYKLFLEGFNNLKDCSWYWYEYHDDRDRYTNHQMVRLRNEKEGVLYEYGDDNETIVSKFSRSKFTASQTRLAAHRAIMKKQSAVWMTNGGSHDVILMLLDFDKKKRKTDCLRAAQYFVDRYLKGRGYIEISTGGKGIHVYFFVSLKYVKRAAFKDALNPFYAMLKSDEVFATFKQTFDDVPVYGIPSIWEKDELGYSLIYRGNQLKCPYLPNGRSDLAKLEELSANPVSGQKLVEWAAKQKPEKPPLPAPLLPSSRQVAPVHQKGHFDHSIGVTGQQRRAKLYRVMKLKNPNLTEDEFVAAYQIKTIQNGGEKKVRRDFRHMEQTFTISSTKPVIDMTKYLDIVKELVPPLAMVTKKGRTKLNHERVAQFVAVKMHDAHLVGEYQAASSRDTVLSFWASLKEQGIVDWSLTKNAHSKLMSICLTYRLLELIEEHTAPSAPGAKNGRCRRIGPGEALGEEYIRFEFTRRRLQSEATKPVSIREAL